MGIKVIKCQCCKGFGVYDQGQCGYCGGVGYIAIEEKPQPVKTLLDEFAMAAMAAIVGKRPYMTVSNGDSDALETALMIVRSDVNGAYTVAAAMMKERARRDEMGNAKEVK